MSDSLWLQGLQHARLLCPSPSPRVYSNSCPLSRWCYLTTHPLLPPLLRLSSIFPSISAFSKLALHIRWIKNWNFSNSPFNEYWGLISFRINWFDLLVVQRTLKSLLQRHSSKVSILWCFPLWSTSYIYIWLLEKPSIALIIWTFVVLCLCFLICCLGLS